MYAMPRQPPIRYAIDSKVHAWGLHPRHFCL
jgi:hypothetical protein